jgi:N-acetylglucosamine-6-phosphate deacetylase
MLHLYLAVKILDPKLQDGVHEWHGGRKIVKEGDKIYLEGTTVLVGRRAPYILIFLLGWLLKVETLFSAVSLDKCVRNFSSFTGCSLGEAIKCATYNPAKSVYLFSFNRIVY